MILPPPPRPADPFNLFLRKLRIDQVNIAATTLSVNASLLSAPPKEVLDRILPLYQLLPATLLRDVLHNTRRYSRRQRALPAHCVVWLVVAQSLFRDRSLPLVWRHLHSCRDGDEPDDSAFTHARKRLGIRPLRSLFRRLVCAAPPLAGACYKRWRLLALDGSVFETPDTPDNRTFFGSQAYGLDAAARLFFGVGAHDLTLAQAAMLAALPNAPTRLSPINDYAGAWGRARRILAIMAREGWITPDDEARALADPPGFGVEQK